MRISIIIPAYNVENYIEDCVESLYQQGLNVNEFEIIIINDGSSDDTFMVLRNLEPKYSNLKIYNQKNKGQSAARNLGIEKALGDYLFFMDADDFLDNGYLFRLLEIGYCEKYDFIGFNNKRVSSRARICNNEDLVKDSTGSGIEISSSYYFNNSACLYLFKRDLLEDLRFIEGKFCEDGMFTVSLLLKVKNGVIFKNTIYNYYISENSTVTANSPEKHLKLALDMFFASKEIGCQLGNVIKNEKLSLKLRFRQESYVFFGIIRFLKSRNDFGLLEKHLLELSIQENSSYPLILFDGYKSKLNQILIRIFNNFFLLKFLVNVNKRVKIF